MTTLQTNPAIAFIMRRKNSGGDKRFSTEELYDVYYKALGYKVQPVHLHRVINKLIRRNLVQKTEWRGLYLIL